MTKLSQYKQFYISKNNDNSYVLDTTRIKDHARSFWNSATFSKSIRGFGFALQITAAILFITAIASTVPVLTAPLLIVPSILTLTLPPLVSVIGFACARSGRHLENKRVKAQNTILKRDIDTLDSINGDKCIAKRIDNEIKENINYSRRLKPWFSHSSTLATLGVVVFSAILSLPIAALSFSLAGFYLTFQTSLLNDTANKNERNYLKDRREEAAFKALALGNLKLKLTDETTIVATESITQDKDQSTHIIHHEKPALWSDRIAHEKEHNLGTTPAL